MHGLSEGKGGVCPAEREGVPLSASLDALPLRLHHVGIAVRDLEAALRLYAELFGFRPVEGPVTLPAQHVRLAFVEAAPGVLLELVEGLDDEAPVRGVLRRAGAGPYHLCYEVEDLDEAIERLRAKRCRLVSRFEQPNGDLRRFAFLMAPDGELFELCAREGGDPS